MNDLAFILAIMGKIAEGNSVAIGLLIMALFVLWVVSVLREASRQDQEDEAQQARMEMKWRMHKQQEQAEKDNEEKPR